jgi:hypothetical protein
MQTLAPRELALNREPPLSGEAFWAQAADTCQVQLRPPAFFRVLCINPMYMVRTAEP